MSLIERANLSVSILALIVAGMSFIFSWIVWSAGNVESRPHLNVSVSLLETRGDNGVFVTNAGLRPAVIHSLTMSDDHSNETVAQAVMDMHSVQFSHDQIVRHAYSNQTVVHPGSRLPLISVDRKIGDTDIRLLTRRFSEMGFQICYCAMNAIDCWTYRWLYKQRDNGLRLEVASRGCSATAADGTNNG